jgi:ectoine hydroxylase-related dioxygenase (phytanoyl-CoA dioxygenase family)
MPLNSEQINTFQNDGVVVLRGIFNDSIEALRTGVDTNMRDPGPFGREYMTEGEAGRFFGDYCNWHRIPEYHDFMFDSEAPAIAASLMQSATARIFHEHVLVKEPGTNRRTPWHHDQPYYCVDGKQVCSMWIPLDSVPKATCPEFVAGSHRWGRWFVPSKFTGVNYDHSDTSLEQIPDFDNHRDDYEFRSWDLEPGDAIAFHFLTVHGAPANLSNNHRRRAYAARFVGDDAVFAQRSGDISPPFPGLDAKLQPGDKLDVEEFPLVFGSN